jgi:chemotaxis protein methyltransferase CheR
MPAPPEDQEAEELEMRLLLEAIHARYGYDLRGYASPSMRRRLGFALRRSGLSNLGELQHQIITNPALFPDVLDDLTVHVSDMFRDPRSHRVFRQQVIPALRAFPQLKIWHAGCASGEELYATAIVLEEEGLSDRAQTFATDLSPRALEGARAAVYPAEKAARWAESYQQAGGTLSFDRYYSEAYGRITVKESLRRNIVYLPHDLAAGHTLGEMQVIFCRNVLIYFGRALQDRVIDSLAGALCPGGFLCLGASEQVPRSMARLEEIAAGSRIYRHRGAPP